MKYCFIIAFLALSITNYSLVHADAYPPQINHEVPVDAIAGQPLKLTAFVTDEDGIENVVLNFKLPSISKFLKREMQQEEGDVYSVLLSASDIKLEGLEYYIEATDNTGAVDSRGFDFDPLILRVNALSLSADNSIGQNPVPVQESSPKKNNTLMYLLGAALLVGLAAGSGGGGGGETATLGYQ